MRALKILVAVMGLLIAAGFVLLIIAVAGHLAPPERGAKKPAAAGVSPPFSAAPIELPQGSRVETMALGADRLVLDLMLAGGERQLIILDLATGRRLGTIPLHQAQ